MMKAKEQFNESESYKLEWAGEKDADARRESLAFRGQEHFRQRAVMVELLSIAKEKVTPGI